MERIRTAILGVGAFSPDRGGKNAIAYAHAEGCRRNPEDFEIVAACARSERNREDFAREYPCRTYADGREMFRAERPGLAVVSTWAGDREEHVGWALEAGVPNILVEKPFALSAGACRRMRDLAAEKGARLFCHFPRRYGRVFEAAREAVLGGRVGDILHVAMNQPCPNALDFGPHFFDAAIFLTDRRDWAEVAACGRPGAGPAWHGLRAEGGIVCDVAFPDGSHWTYSAADPLPGAAERPALRVDGTRGFVEIRLSPLAGEAAVLRILTPDGLETPVFGENFHHADLDRTGDSGRYLFHGRMYADLAHAIRSGAPCRIDAADAVAVQEIECAAYQSMRDGAPVRPGSLDPDFVCLRSL